MEQFKQNYFELFGLTESFRINQEELADKYRALQNQWHPDRFSRAEERDKLRAVQMSSFLNQAFNVLSTPVLRAGYMLSQKGSDIEKVSQQDMGMDLLMEQMQLREALEDLPADESALDELDVLKAKVHSKLQNTQNRFAEEIEADAIDAAKKSYHELQFLVKLFKEIEVGEEQRLGY